MTRFARIIKLSGLCLILGISALHAEVINYNATFNSTTDFYFNFQQSTFNLSQTNFNANPTPNLSGNFAAGDQLRVTFSAPAGSVFSIEPPPTGTTFHRMIVRLWRTGNLSSRTLVPGGTIEFSGLTGTAPTLVESSLVLDPFQFGGVEALFDVGAFSFQSISMLFDVPSGSNLNGITPYIEFGVYAGVPKSVSTSDPGPRAFIVENPVPEPSFGLLAAAALAAFSLVRKK